jgi:hypothetical protein
MYEEISVGIVMLVAAFVVGLLINKAAEKNITIKELILGKPHK